MSQTNIHLARIAILQPRRRMSLFGRSDSRLQAVLEPPRLIRWVYVARLSLAWAILIAALITRKIEVRGNSKTNTLTS